MVATSPSTPGHLTPPDRPWGTTGRERTVWPTQLQEELVRATLLEDERALIAWQRIRPTLAPATMDHSIQAFLPQLRRNLQRLGVEDQMLELFKGVHRYGWARNQLLMAEVLPVVEALEHAGIQTLLLKGAALVADERHDAGVRQMSDIDVLVRTGSLAAACAVLIDHGMTPVEDVPLWYVTEYAPRFKHSCNFRNAAEGQLDLHWHALKWSCHPDADADFWAASQPVRLRELSSRALCPADELMLVILHGLRWSPTPSYRWILDAALIVRGASAPIDYDRIVAQARRHRVTHATRAGLLRLAAVAQVDVPAEALRALLRPAPLQRLELRGQATQPRWRRPAERMASLHLQYVRREVAPGRWLPPSTHVRLVAERVGVERPIRIRQLFDGGSPGPGRPFAELMAPIGDGRCTPSARPWGAFLDFGDPEVVRDHCLYGMWLPADGSSWIAGREARLRIALPEVPSTPLLLELAAGGFTPAGYGQHLEVLLEGEIVGSISFGATRSGVEAESILLPDWLVRGRSSLDLALRAPNAIAPAALGLSDDQRRLGVFIRRLAIRPPRLCPLGERVGLGTGSDDPLILAGGWADAEPGGRWTQGSEARMVLCTDTPASVLAWNAEPVHPLRVEVTANGMSLGVVNYDRRLQETIVPLEPAGRPRNLVLSWHLREPRSPRELGLSDDERQLGLFFRSVRLS